MISNFSKKMWCELAYVLYFLFLGFVMGGVVFTDFEKAMPEDELWQKFEKFCDGEKQ